MFSILYLTVISMIEDTVRFDSPRLIAGHVGMKAGEPQPTKIMSLLSVGIPTNRPRGGVC